jgi:hypothetical protein
MEDFDLPRLHAQMMLLTRDQATAEDLVSEAVVQTLEKGEPLVGGRIYAFAKLLWLRDRQRGQGRVAVQDPFVLAQTLEREPEGETLLVSMDRCRRRGHRNGGRPRVAQEACAWCSEPFTPRRRRGAYTTTCSMSCGAKLRHDRNRREQALASVA